MVSSPRRHGRGTSDGVVQLEHLHLAIAIPNRLVVIDAVDGFAFDGLELLGYQFVLVCLLVRWG